MDSGFFWLNWSYWCYLNKFTFCTPVQSNSTISQAFFFCSSFAWAISFTFSLDGVTGGQRSNFLSLGSVIAKPCERVLFLRLNPSASDGRIFNEATFKSKHLRVVTQATRCSFQRSASSGSACPTLLSVDPCCRGDALDKLVKHAGGQCGTQIELRRLPTS